MASRVFPGLGLRGGYVLGEDGWDEAMTEDLRKLSAVVHLAVISSVASLPVSPSNGDRYILTADDSAGGSANDVALRENGEWIFFTPELGWEAYVVSEDQKYRFTDFESGGGWEIVETGGSGGTDNQTAAQVPYTPPAGETANDVQEALDLVLPRPYDIGVFVEGSVDDLGKDRTHVVVRAFAIPPDFLGSQGYAEVTNSSQIQFTIFKNNDEVGRVTFGAGSNTATFDANDSSSEIEFAPGDRLTFVTPLSLGTMANVSITVLAHRA